VYRHHIAELQQKLLKDGCYLIGVGNADFDDLALNATATASSQMAETGAEKINNGWNRVIGGDRNAWAPDPNASGPAWVRLQFAQVSEFETLHVTFEQQCVACQVQVFADDVWRTVATIEDAPTRRMVLRFAPVKADRLRLLFEKTPVNVAVCEVRVYHERGLNAAVVDTR
jgi:hypothetical protein